MKLRDYQERAINDLWAWFERNPTGHPVMDACVGAGKSLMIAEVARRAFTLYPDLDMRILVVVHQKELLEQNVEKLRAIMPGEKIGIYSAALRKKDYRQRITFATIGSIYKSVHKLGKVDLVMADECHLISPNEAGMWREMVADLQQLNPYCRVIGWTGTPFRGNGVWLTAWEKSLFTGIATRVTMDELIEKGYLVPLKTVPTEAHIDTSNVRVVGNEYVVSDLDKAARAGDLVDRTAAEIIKLARVHARRRWLVFAVTVEHAEQVSASLRRQGVRADIVSAETPAAERDEKIKMFREGRLTALVNVAVLTTGFDVPEVDFIALLRATRSPVLYVQIGGRGMRVVGGSLEASRMYGKVDCLWADFTDTTLRMGPMNKVRGKQPKPKGGKREAPFKVCEFCGTRNPTAALLCMECGTAFAPPERIKHDDKASTAEVMASNSPYTDPIAVSDVAYDYWLAEGKSTPTMRVDYFSGIRRVASEFICIEHSGFPREKAIRWWLERNPDSTTIPDSVEEAVREAKALPLPTHIVLDKSEKYPRIISYHWGPAT